MTSVVRSTIRRWNGEAWDYVYFATDGSIVSLGKPLQIAYNSGTFDRGTVIPADTPIVDILERIIDRIAYLDGIVVPDLRKRSGTVAHALHTMEATSSVVALADIADLGANDDIMVVCVNRSVLMPAVDYVLSDATIVFTSALAAGTIVHLITLRQ